MEGTFIGLSFVLFEYAREITAHDQGMLLAVANQFHLIAAALFAPRLLRNAWDSSICGIMAIAKYVTTTIQQLTQRL